MDVESDSILKDQYILTGADYDHFGYRQERKERIVYMVLMITLQGCLQLLKLHDFKKKINPN